MLENILIVDDEPLICKLVAKALEEEGFATQTAANGKQMLSYLENNIPDLIILDYLLPDINGHELCRQVRENSTTPILMITAHDNDANIVRGFEMGIDDLLAKPFNPKELILRVQAILRRTKSTQDKIEANSKNSDQYHFGPWTFTSDNSNLKHEDSSQSLILTEYETKLLNVLCSNPNQVITREQLYKALESNSDNTSLQAINVYVYRLRTKIGKAFIQSVRYKGYKFTP